MGDHTEDDKDQMGYKVNGEKAHRLEQEISGSREALVLVSPLSPLHSAPQQENEGEGDSPVGNQTPKERAEHQSIFPSALDLTESCEPIPDHSDSEFESTLVDDSIYDYPQESEMDITSPSIYEQLLSLTGCATVSSAKRKMCAENERANKTVRNYVDSPKIGHFMETRTVQNRDTEAKRNSVLYAKKALNMNMDTKADNKPPKNSAAGPRFKKKPNKTKTLIGGMSDDMDIHTGQISQTELAFQVPWSSCNYPPHTATPVAFGFI
ncbi:unnamed protein product [Dibothriocephalus latus]|uniref:Uncharacterized protein n=1 Tax=Dibothriocephalus latus TaxID=60516 RepID=A0A3P7LIF0_DIBLA|nr:unnamed protein product [Dibothriocephalus latus]